ncbi:MAG: peptide chain release factor 1 [Eubacteriales bacterium]
MFEKLDKIVARYNELSGLLADPAVISDNEKYKALMKEQSGIDEIVQEYLKYKKLNEELEDTREMVSLADDKEMQELAKEEEKVLSAEVDHLIENLKLLLVPKDPNDDKNVVLEIRAGTGGDEAALFGMDLLRMYTRFTEREGFKMDFLSSNYTEKGGVKEVVIGINGKGVFGKMKFESGVHRVQRVPETESSGRIHTSAATVAVLPEAEDVDVTINPNDLRVDVYRSSGNGGQSVNTTDSAVRITHIPSGLVVTCQDEKSQLKNKDKAMKILKTRLYDLAKQEHEAELSEHRKSQVGTGDRSERIRTYNFPQGRVTDHRINLTLYKLDAFLDGDLYEMLEALAISAKQDALTSEE